MARRPKRIDLEAISDSTHKDHKKHCEALIMDLLRKHPRGPECKLVREDYRHTWTGHDVLLEAADGFEKNCGYSDLVLYRLCSALQVDGSEWDWCYKMRSMFPDLGKGGHTRRSRRLSQRTHDAYHRIRRAGRPGIYTVSFGHGYGRDTTTTVNVFAENTDMAKMVAQISVGASYPEVDSDNVNATFQREGCPSEIMGLNSNVTMTCSRLVEQKHELINKLHKEIELLELRAVMIKTYSIGAVDQ